MMGDESNSKKEKESIVNNPWITGGMLGSRSCVLQFRCGALSKAPVAPPGDTLHMTYKTYQAETKLLAAVLNAHGLREELKNHYIFSMYLNQPSCLSLATVHEQI